MILNKERLEILEYLYKKKIQLPIQYITRDRLLNDLKMDEAILFFNIRYLKSKYLINYLPLISDTEHPDYSGVEITMEGIDYYEEMSENHKKNKKGEINE